MQIHSDRFNSDEYFQQFRFCFLLENEVCSSMRTVFAPTLCKKLYIYLCRDPSFIFSPTKKKYCDFFRFVMESNGSSEKRKDLHYWRLRTSVGLWIKIYPRRRIITLALCFGISFTASLINDILQKQMCLVAIIFIPAHSLTDNMQLVQSSKASAMKLFHKESSLCLQ